MSLENRINRIKQTLEKQFGATGGLCRCTVNGSRIEYWEQLVNGSVRDPISEPVRTGEPAETTCALYGLETRIIKLCVIKKEEI